MTTTTQHLPHARNKLHNALATLTAPQTRHHNNQTHTAPSLYNQLQDAITGYHNNGYNGVHQSQPPLWIDATDLLNEIDQAAEIWHPQLAGIPRTVGRLKSLATNGVTGHGWRPQDIHNMTQITRALQQWAQRIQALLNPDAIKHLRNPNNTGYAPCPQCGHTTTKRPDPCDPDGPPIRTPTLQWTAETGTTCTVCKASWEPRQTLFLSRLLGFELPEGVLE